MPLQPFNSINTDLNAGIFQRRREPQFASAMSNMGMMLAGLVGFWPFSEADSISVGDISGQGRNMAYFGGFSTDQISSIMIQYGAFDGVNGYLKRPSEPDLAITGSLTFAAWVKFEVNGVEQGIAGKWYTAGNQRGWRIYRTASNTIVFEVSSDGIASTSVTSAAVTINNWTFVSGVYTPSDSIKVGIGRLKVSNTTSIPASIYASNEALEFGRTNRGSYMDGNMALAILAKSSSASMIDSYYEYTRAIFGVL